MKKGLAFRNQKKREGWKTESEEETREEVQRVFFHFLSKGVPRENTVTGDGGFPFR